MKSNLSLTALATLALASVLSLAGCKSNTTSPTTSQPAQPASSSAVPAPNASSPAPSDASTPAASPAPAVSSSAPPAAAPVAAVAPSAPPPPAAINLPIGTRIPVRLDEDLGSKISEPGQSFRATIADDVLHEGQVIIPRGARAEGTVIDAKPLGRFKGGALLEVRLERVHTKWGSYPVSTSTVDRVEKGKGKRSAGFIGGGAGFGALIGGLAGGGKGAAIGALAGGGAGTAGSAFTGNKQIFLPAETMLTFHLEHPVHIVMQQ